MPRRVPGAALGMLALGALAAGCGAGPLSSPAEGVGCSVTVNIPSDSAGLLGTVVASYEGNVDNFTRNTNTIPIGCGRQVKLSVAARSPQANPFIAWKVDGTTTTDSTVTITVTGATSVTPQFHVPVAPTPTPSPTAKPSPSPSATPTSVTLDQWMSYDSSTKTATLKLIAGYQNVNNTLSYDGEAYGKLVVTVPVGWKLVVNFSNQGKINHSAAVVTPTGTTPVFPGASVPNPTVGLPVGASDTFSFVAATVGNYRIACLVPGHEGLGMWATFNVTSGGLPTIHL